MGLQLLQLIFARAHAGAIRAIVAGETLLVLLVQRLLLLLVLRLLLCLPLLLLLLAVGTFDPSEYCTGGSAHGSTLARIASYPAADGAQCRTASSVANHTTPANIALAEVT